MNRIALAVSMLLVASSAWAGNIFDDINKQLKKLDPNQQKNAAKPDRDRNAPLAAPVAQPAYPDADLTAGGLDVVGLKIGMTADEAKTIIQAREMKCEVKKSSYLYPAVVTSASTRGKGDPYEYDNYLLICTKPGDQLKVSLTPEATPRVYRIERTVAPASGTALLDNWGKALIEKYGQPVSDTSETGRHHETVHNTGRIDYAWGKGTGPGCGGENLWNVPNYGTLERARKSVGQCGPWSISAKAYGPPPYMESATILFVGHALIDTVAYATYDKMLAHHKQQSAEALQKAEAASKAKPDL